MKKMLATVTCGLAMAISFATAPMSVEASSAVSIRSADGNYSTMGFGGNFYEMESEVRERLAEGHDNPIWFIASENCHTEAEYHFSTDKEKEDFLTSIKVFRPIQIKNNEIETLVCIGDGLGIQKNMKY